MLRLQRQMVRVQQQEVSPCALLETVVILSFLCPKSCGISSTQFCLFVSFHYLELLTWYCTTSLVPAHLPGRVRLSRVVFLAFLKTTAYSSLLIRFSPVMDITTTHKQHPDRWRRCRNFFPSSLTRRFNKSFFHLCLTSGRLLESNIIEVTHLVTMATGDVQGSTILYCKHAESSS